VGRDAGLLPRDVQALLETSSFGRRMYYVDTVDSTNRLARDLARAGEPDGTVVTADFQTEGRGRHGRRWISPRGANLTFSLILRPDAPLAAVLPVTLAFSLAIAEALTERLGSEIGVKWPNDVVAPPGKLCGILAEGSARSGKTDFVVVGVGINVNMKPEEFTHDVRAASCLSLSGVTHERRVVLAEVLDRLERVRDAFLVDGFAGVVDRYTARCSLVGQDVSVAHRGGVVAGAVVGVQPDGALVIRERGGETLALYDGEVTRR
jgi:BirA family biotin operon repressor/biotin-[acetyl-CoA-carboxylase] ligase